MSEIDELARAIVDRGRYMALGTADGDGRPWVSPVWFAPVGYGAFLWVSSPEARHSQNIAERPDVSMVIFDSGAALGQGAGVYMSGRAGLVDEGGLEAAMEAFTRRSLRDGGDRWSVEAVRAPARVRLYRAVVSECWLGRRDERFAVSATYLS